MLILANYKCFKRGVMNLVAGKIGFKLDSKKSDLENGRSLFLETNKLELADSNIKAWRTRARAALSVEDRRDKVTGRMMKPGKN